MIKLHFFKEYINLKNYNILKFKFMINCKHLPDLYIIISNKSFNER